MTEPRAERPEMLGYGLSDDPAGLLPWSWAEERLTRSHDYWLATIRADGRPHLMPVWGVWHEEALWFSSALRSRKARNLAADDRCSVATDDAYTPVVIEGRAAVVRDSDDLNRFCAAMNRKYDIDYAVDFYDPDVNATYRLAPAWAFGLDEAEFSTSPTRWVFS